jgi:hypothetical protein
VSDPNQIPCQSKQTPLEEQQFLFLLEEYKSLRAEIDTRIKESFTLVIYCVTAIAAIYGPFVAAALSDQTHPNTHLNLTLLRCVIPAAIMFPVFGLIKSNEAWRIMLRIAEHLRGIEKSLGVEEGGWETATEKYRRKQPQTFREQMSNVAKLMSKPPYKKEEILSNIEQLFSKPPYFVFWLMLIVITVGVWLICLAV